MCVCVLCLELFSEPENVYHLVVLTTQGMFESHKYMPKDKAQLLNAQYSFFIENISPCLLYTSDAADE